MGPTLSNLNKLNRVISLAIAALTLLTPVALLAPADADAQAISRTERRCRSSLARASRRYFDQTMVARQECERRRIQRRSEVTTDCLAPVSEMNDQRTRQGLERATTRLSQDLADSCTGVDLAQLGFPGICGPPADGADFDIFDLFQCTVDDTNALVDALLHVNFPTFDGFFTDSAARCVRAVNDRARRMVKRELRARQDCMLQQEKGRFGFNSTIDCREQVPPYGLGTGDDKTDSAIVAAYRNLLTTLPAGCATANVRGLYGGNGCPDSTGGGFNVFDLQLCVFDAHRAADPPLMELSFPSPPDCGNGQIEGEEQCDEGDDNSENGPCLPDCTLAACPDGLVCSQSACTTGPSGGPENCDDGNQNDNDACRNDCADATCGDGVLCDGAGCSTGPGGGAEQCDEAAANDSGPCLTSCALASCGDSTTCTSLQCTTGPDGGPEACDDGGESTNCNGDCSPSLCGDAKINMTDMEECDDGFANNQNVPNACRTNCKLPVCGDSIVDDRFGEACDPPNGFSCNDSCQALLCGNGQIDGLCTGDLATPCQGDDDCTSAGGTCRLEECDDGDGNSDTAPNACRTDCTNPSCGDSVIDDQFSEVCDDGATNGSSAPCLSDCQAATCGDGNTCTAAGCSTGPGSGAEQCDNGSANSDTAPDGCRTNCGNAFCGDGVSDSGEECDNGSGNSDTAPDACRTSCLNAFCGDGVQDIAEACDDGGANSDNARCLSSCDTATCGDGVACSSGNCTSGPGGGAEDCDDIGESADCNADCSDAECGDGQINASAEEQCDEGGENGSGSGCSNTCQCEAGAVVTGCLEAQCPIKGELLIYAGVTGISCSSDDDCPVPPEVGGGCDLGLGRCVTATKLDSGWQGIAHNSDITDQIRTVGSLSCPGPYDPDSPEPCGECEVTGVLPETQDCRCSNDIRTICDDTFELDFDDCNLEGISCTTDDDCRRCNESTEISCLLDSECPDGEFCMGGGRQPTCVNSQCVGECNCFLGPPLALSAANTPACVVNRLSQDVSGTANVDLGEGRIAANLLAVVFLGERVTTPCPVCAGSCDSPAENAGTPCLFDRDCDSSVNAGDGQCGNFDAVAKDGERGGTCFLGQTAGRPCDIGARNETFPFPGGGGHSLDCPPATGKNVSGLGLIIDFEQNTGTSSLDATISCGFPFLPELCQCGQCDGTAENIPCSSDADCAPDLGECASVGLGSPRPHSCSDGVCELNTEVGGNNGVCQVDVTRFCDGALRANGEPFVTCLSDADCEQTDCGPVSCGTCTATLRKPCFLPTIEAQGRPDPQFPIGAAVFCVPQTANPGINSAAGLPGPGRIVNQARSTTFCASDPSVQYIPGVGGCPAP